jgi:adenylate cyclase
MAEKDFKRKLAAILSADVAGYSRLMREDDDATVHTLIGHRKMMSALIRRHQGRVVDIPGDNLLAEFDSVLHGVNCAVEIQRELAERNAGLPEDRKMEYRIGVNLGDVIQEGNRIYGDGVNIAARLESLAEPGGICISGIVYSQVKNRLKLEYEILRKKLVKNISEPVPVYRIISLPKATVLPPTTRL